MAHVGSLAGGLERIPHQIRYILLGMQQNWLGAGPSIVDLSELRFIDYKVAGGYVQINFKTFDFVYYLGEFIKVVAKRTKMKTNITNCLLLGTINLSLQTFGSCNWLHIIWHV